MTRRIIKGKAPIYKSLLREQFNESIPFDVTFEIVENGDDNQVKENKKEVKAHKIILATFSSVFRAMFFGPVKETKDVITVKETTAEAFKTMIEYFYQVDIDCGEIDVIEMFDIVNLAEKYNVTELNDELKEQMEKVPITMDNLMEVAAIASKFSQFGDISSALLLNCAKLFKKEVRTSGDQVKFMLEQHARGDCTGIAMDILALSKTLPPVECENCKEENCMDGQPVEHAKFEKGLKVKVNTSCDYWATGEDALCFIVEELVGFGSNRVRMREEVSLEEYNELTFNAYNVSTLCYNCAK